MPTPLALVFDMIAVDRASPVFNRVAASADRTAVATGRAEKSAVGFGGAMKAAFAGLAIGAVAAEAVKAAAQFQKSMLAIQTQAGASAREVKTFSSALLTLGPKVATGPEDLSVSLYHVYSALKKVGATGPQMLNAVKIAAEGAKVGNTDLEDTTNSLTATLASGIVKFNQAGKAMGYLNAIVGAGDMKFSDLNQALGTGLLVTMKTFGVSIRDTGAALAVFGDNNIRGADAATKLRMSVQDLAKPAAHADDYLSKIHLTADRLRTALTEHGLNDALQLLKQHLDDAGVTGSKVGAFLEDAFTKKAGAGLAVLLTRLNQFDEARKTVEKGANSFGDAWKATTQTASFAFDRIKATVEAFGISIGTKLLPYVSEAAQWLGTNLPKAFHTLGQIVAPVARLVGDVLRNAWRLLVPVVKTAWNVLSGIGHFLASNTGVVKGFAVTLGVLWAAFKGYAIVSAVVGALKGLFAAATAGGSVLSTLRLRAMYAADSLKGLSLGATAVTGVLGIGLAAWFAYSHQQQQAKQTVDDLTKAIESDSGALGKNTREAAANALQQAGAFKFAHEAGIGVGLLTSAMLGQGDALETVRSHLKRLSASQVSYVNSNRGSIRSTTDAGRAADELLRVLGDENGYVKQAVQQARDHAAATRAQKSATDAAVGSLRVETNATYLAATAQGRMQAATDRLKEAQKQLKNALKDLAGTLSAAAEAVAYQQAINSFTQSLKDNKGALLGHSDAALQDKGSLIDLGSQIVQRAQDLKNSGASWKTVTGFIVDHIKQLRDQATAAGASKTQFDKLLTSLHLMPKQVRTTIEADTSAAKSALDNLRATEENTAIRVPVTTYLPNGAGINVGGGRTGFSANAAGGAIRGPGTPTSDSIPARLSNGEHVLTASDVVKAGGQGAVYRMRRMIQSGMLRFAKGGGVDSSLLSLIRRAGFSGAAARTMYGIVEAESGGNRLAHNTNSATGDNSYGLAQINMIGSMGPARRRQFGLSSNNALFDPLTNLRVAYALSQHGRNFSPWTTYTSGAYLAHMGGYDATVSGGGGGGPITVAHVGGKKVWQYGGQNYSSLSAAQNARQRDAQSSIKDAQQRQQTIRSNSLSTINSMLGSIGSAPNGPQINVAQTGIGLVERQLDAARAKLANLPGLTGKDRARFQAQIARLVKEAQRQLDKLRFRIRHGDEKAFRKAIGGTVQDARQAFKAMFDDLKAYGAPGGVLDRLQRLDSRMLHDIAERNRFADKLAAVVQRDKQFRGSVRSGIVGSFDVTSAGVNRSGDVTPQAEFAQQKQALIQIERFKHGIEKLGKRGLNRAYLQQLALAGPPVLPQVDALLRMGSGQFGVFNRREGRILDLGRSTGNVLGRDLFGGREQALRRDERVWDRRVDKMAHRIEHAVEQGINHAKIELDGKNVNRKLDESRKRHGDLHGASS